MKMKVLWDLSVFKPKTTSKKKVFMEYEIIPKDSVQPYSEI